MAKAKNNNLLYIGIAVVVVVAVIIGVIVAVKGNGGNNGGDGGTSQDAGLTAADLAKVDVEIEYGDYDGMEKLSKSIQNGEMTGKVVKIDGIVMHPGTSYSIGQANEAGSSKIGTQFDRIVIDEAQELTADQQEGMLPTVSASSDAQDAALMPQQIYIGTPPGPTCNGTIFRQMHDSAHETADPAIWWLEWGIETDDIVGTISSRDKAIEFAYQTNPAMGYRIAEKTVENEFDTMRLDGFARERLGWWTPVVEHKVEYAIPKDTWDACKSTEPKPEGKTAYGVKFSADGSMVALCGAVIPDSGPARISLIDMRPTGHGVRWLADWLNDRYNKACCVVIDGRNGVDVLVERISDTWRMKGSVVRPSTKDMIAATGTLMDALAERSVTWFWQQGTLEESAITSVKRPLGGGWGFGGDNSIPIEAASLALWGATNSKRNPNKKMRIG